MVLDLKELEIKLDVALSNETSESLANWLKVKREQVCSHEYIETDPYWKACIHCGNIVPIQK